MKGDEETAATITALLLVKKNKKKRKRSVLVKSWLRRRINLGFYETIVKELRFEEKSEYKNSYAGPHMALIRFCDLSKMI